MDLQKDILEFIGQYLLTSNESISVAESVTAGFLQFSFSQMKDASKIFKGGITAYTLEEKVNLLHIDEKEGRECDCVSQHIAETMALHVAEIFNTHWSVAVTGYASPVEESDYQLFAYFSFAYKGEIILSRKKDLHPGKESTNAQLCYSDFILECLKDEMLKRSSSKQ